MSALEEEALRIHEMELEHEKKQAGGTKVVGFVRAQTTEPKRNANGEGEAQENPEEIDIDIDLDSEDEGVLGQVAIPGAVYGSLADV